MNTLIIDQTDRTPKIRFSYGNLLLWGSFVPVNPAEFCSVLHEWVKEYLFSPAPVTTIDLGLAYVRGYSMNYIQNLLQELIMLHNDNHQIIINWYFSPNSIDVKAGEFLSRKLNHSFNYVEIEEIW